MKASSIWLVFHGYGERADEFIEQCRPLLGSNQSMIAPEALSRFYPRGGGGKVGASWMTSDLRQEEIVEYVEFVDSVLRTELGDAFGNARISVLGFSQGGSTAMRWSLLGSHRPNRLVMWMSSFRAEELQPYIARLRTIDLVMVAGEKDRLMNRTEYDGVAAFLDANGVSWREVVRGGGHQVDAEGLALVRDS
jgi:predicted esterase